MPEKEPPPLVKLPAEIKTQLEGLEATVKRARRDIETMRKLGMDVKPLEDKLEWAESARKTLLSEFG